MTVLLCAGIFLMLFGIGSDLMWMAEFGKGYEKSMGYVLHGGILIFIWCALKEVHSDIKKRLSNPKRGD